MFFILLYYRIYVFSTIMMYPSPLGALGAVGEFANPGASRRIATISKGPSAPLRSASPGLLGIFWATRRKKRDDAFPLGSLWASTCLRRASRAAWGPSGLPRRARKTRVSCGPHAILRHRSVARSQASSAFRAKPTKFQPFPRERPKPCETPSLSGAPRGEGLCPSQR